MNHFVIKGGSLSAKELEAVAGGSNFIRRPAVLLTVGTHNNGKADFSFTPDDLKKIVENTKKLSASGKTPKLRVKHSANAWDHIGYIPAESLSITADGNKITGLLEFRDLNARQKIENGLWEPGKQALSVGVYGDTADTQYLEEVSIVETGACPEAVMLENNKNGGTDMPGKAETTKPQEGGETATKAAAENAEMKALLEKQAAELEAMKKAQGELISKITSAFGGSTEAKTLLEKQEPAQAMAILGETVEKIGAKLEATVKELEAEKTARKKESDAKIIDGFVASGKIIPAVREQELELFGLMPEAARKIYLEKMAKTPAIVQIAGSPLDKPAPDAEDDSFLTELEKVAAAKGIKLEKK